MIPLKKILFVSSFTLMTFMASGQALTDIHIGLYSCFLSSDSLKSTPGPGLEIGARSQARISRRLDFFSTYSVYFATFNVNGYHYTEDASFNPIVKNTSPTFDKIGLNYAVGIDYYIIPDKFSVGAGIGIAVNDIIGEAPLIDSLGAVPTSVQTMRSTAQVTDLEHFNFDYGVHANLIYRLPKVQFSLEYFKGFSSLTSGYNSSMNDIMLAVHFHLRDISYAKPYQNKLTK